MTLTTDERLGPYKILSPLGAGGMGKVWRARDTRLEREVAIKVLPAEFAKDAGRLRRFEQEARATSVTNHPNILTIYDIGDHEGTPYIVVEVRHICPGQRGASIPRGPLIRALSAALPTAGSRLLRRELGREVIANHAERYDRREAVLRRPVCPRQAGLIHRLQ